MTPLFGATKCDQSQLLIKLSGPPMWTPVAGAVLWYRAAAHIKAPLPVTAWGPRCTGCGNTAAVLGFTQR